MIIKVQCPCGSKYSFEVEPVEGRMPFAVNCPTCQADGTEAANQLIAQALAAEAGSQPKLRVRVATAAEPPVAPRPFPETTPRVSAMQRLQEERRQGRRVAWIAVGVGLVVVALLAAWGWFAFAGSKPHLAYSLKLPGAESSWRTGFLDAHTILLVNPERAVAHDLTAKRDLWSTALSDKPSGDAEAEPPQYLHRQGEPLDLPGDPRAPAQARVRGNPADHSGGGAAAKLHPGRHGHPGRFRQGRNQPSGHAD